MRGEGLLIVGPYPTDPEPDLAYAGFDGDFWPSAPPNDPLLEKGLAPFEELESIKIIAQRSRLCEPTRLIAICDDGLSLGGFDFCGFDVGILESSYDHFSLILNDILNSHGLFREQVSSLNEFRLFKTGGDAESFAMRRFTCKQEIEPLESAKIQIFPIWLWNR